MKIKYVKPISNNVIVNILASISSKFGKPIRPAFTKKSNEF